MSPRRADEGRRSGTRGTARSRRVGTSSRTITRNMRRTGVTAGTTTMILTTDGSTSHQENAAEQPAVLRLRLSRRARVRWSDDTHDNEHDGKKSSKSCCIFHKKRAWDESSTESEDDPSEDDGNQHGSSEDKDGDGESSNQQGHMHGRSDCASSTSRRSNGPGSRTYLQHHDSNSLDSDGSSSSGGPVRVLRRHQLPHHSFEEQQPQQP